MLREDVGVPRYRCAMDGNEPVSWSVLQSPVGELTVLARAAGLIQVAFSSPAPVLARFPVHEPSESGGPAAETCGQLREYFAGKRQEFTVPIDWAFATGFRAHVLRTLHQQVRFGDTVSYQELARRSGRDNAARSVGTIMGSNPVPIIVPCHRVLASGGGMGGFGPGLEAKRRLLVLEGVLGPSLLDSDLLFGQVMQDDY